jgi:cephalosporin hydroxylase
LRTTSYRGGFCIVFDTVIEDLPLDTFPDRPWGKGNNPNTAVRDFLKNHPEFEIDRSIHDKLQITVASDGYLQSLGLNPAGWDWHCTDI